MHTHYALHIAQPQPQVLLNAVTCTCIRRPRPLSRLSTYCLPCMPARLPFACVIYVASFQLYHRCRHSSFSNIQPLQQQQQQMFAVLCKCTWQDTLHAICEAYLRRPTTALLCYILHARHGRNYYVVSRRTLLLVAAVVVGIVLDLRLRVEFATEHWHFAH